VAIAHTIISEVNILKVCAGTDKGGEKIFNIDKSRYSFGEFIPSGNVVEGLSFLFSPSASIPENICACHSLLTHSG